VVAEAAKLTAQMRRASVSVPSNIAEGQGRRLVKSSLDRARQLLHGMRRERQLRLAKTAGAVVAVLAVAMAFLP